MVFGMNSCNVYVHCSYLITSSLKLIKSLKLEIPSQMVFVAHIDININQKISQQKLKITLTLGLTCLKDYLDFKTTLTLGLHQP